MDIKRLINKKTKAIIIVHIYGQPCKIDEIKKICKKNNLFLIEDCAESLGATYKKRKVGLDSDCSTFSFYANKNITTGEGGMAIFKNKKMSDISKKIRNQGASKNIRFWNEYVGSNYRMTNMQAAIGIEQLKKINFFLKKRKNIFEIYKKNLEINKAIIFLPNNNWSENSYWLFTVIIKNIGLSSRDVLIKKLLDIGIETRPGFYPLSIMPPFKKYSKRKLINSHNIGFNSISLPTYISLKNSEIKYISLSLLNILNKLNIN